MVQSKRLHHKDLGFEMTRIIFLTTMFCIGLFAKTGYLKQTIKSPNNVICIYKYNGSLYAKNIGKKRYCKKAVKIDELVKN
jgi:hypothetical protein